MTQRVLYAVRYDDAPAAEVTEHLKRTLVKLLEHQRMDEDIDRHVMVLTISGEEPPCAPFDSIAIFSSTEIRYPSRFFRIITADNRERLIGHIPLWAQSSNIQIAFDPKADLNRKEKKTQKACFDLSCRDLHRRVGGFAAPKRKQPHYASGRKARVGKPYFAQP